MTEPASTIPVRGHAFGTAPVFLATISTILGAILFLRFGYAVGHLGLLGALLLILLASKKMLNLCQTVASCVCAKLTAAW